jgi:Methyltransferase domain
LSSQIWLSYRGYARSLNFADRNSSASVSSSPDNAFRDFLETRKGGGPGIWKWNHYFDIYDRHFSRFRDREVHVLEIGIYSGGSLEMWRDYFGRNCHIYGVDIEPACKAYERDGVRVFIGDQSDRGFWKRFRQEVGTLDIVVDDGGHLPEQQIVTVEELLPYLSPSGVYLCEDLHGRQNGFAAYIFGMSWNLNAIDDVEENFENPERRLLCKASAVQSAIKSIHLYPFVTVIEKNDVKTTEFVAPKIGTKWEPFYK